MIKKINKILFLIFIFSLGFTFFTKNNYKKVDEINPELLKEPLQKEVRNKSIIKFEKDDYEYELDPLYDYEINGLIVSKTDYRWFSIYKRDSVFPVDLCLIWGDNVESRVYQSKNITFKQDFRFCLYNYFGNIDFNHQQLSNNYLVIKDSALEKKLNSLTEGDQVKIKGKLVNIKAKKVGEAGKYDSDYFTWNSSTTRDDSSGGACETIFIEDIEILKKGNYILHLIYKISLYGLLALFFINIVVFLYEVR